MATVAEAQTTTKNFEKLKRLLEELFQMDQADLDFGIFRIMNAKRDEVVQFLDKDLLPQVKEAFSQYQSADRSEIKSELDDAINQAKSLGADPETIPRVKELREKYDSSSVDVAELESEVFSHLYNFFRRYYHEGDFISLRRYKEGVYAIPYEGEEVKLHWANHDQYYIKTSEYLRDYTFLLDSGERVRVHLVAASTEQNNKKPVQGKDRRFVLCSEAPVFENDGELYIRFEYKPSDSKSKQEAFNRTAVDSIVEALGEGGFENSNWVEQLTRPVPTIGNKDRTALGKHLERFTARHTFDYFIHKDLGGFLSRELDFYIKNEVMHLDDIENESTVRVEQYLSKAVVLRRIATKVISFLAQLENYQKKIWLKKKFVTDVGYCISVGRIPGDLIQFVLNNEQQIDEWIELFGIDRINSDLHDAGFSRPLTKEFLLSQPSLVVDTRHFSKDFVDRLLAQIPDIELATSGVIFNANNSDALGIIRSKHIGGVDVVYNDPPYNTDASEILYKNGYKNSSWCALMDGVNSRCRELLKNSGILCTTIDDEQYSELSTMIADCFGKENVLGSISIRSNPSGRITLRGMAQCHEYAIFAGKSKSATISKLPRSDEQLARFDQADEKGKFEWRNFRRDGSSSTRQDRPKQFFPILVTESSLRIPQIEWIESQKEYKILEQPKKAEEILFPIDSSGNERCWRWGLETAREKFAELVVRTNPQGKIQVYNKYRPNAAGVLPLTIWTDKKYSSTEYGTGIVKQIFGTRSPFDFPKSLYATEDCIRISMEGGDGLVLDCFGGSATTGHAVIKLNREDSGSRKFILVEMGHHFESVTCPRIKKICYAPDWKKGNPETIAKDTHLFKYIRLESYEDALNNLELKKDQQQQLVLGQDKDLNEQYVLSYMLDVESRGSQSLLNVEGFRNPDAYKLKVERDGETQMVNVDLVETFNWLLGLTVKHIDVIGTKATGRVRVVTGTNPEGEKVLVLWRNQDDTDNEALEKWFTKQGYNSRDQEYDLIYINGDNNLENLRKEDETWKVRLIEEEFGRLMFDVEDV